MREGGSFQGLFLGGWKAIGEGGRGGRGEGGTGGEVKDEEMLASVVTEMRRRMQIFIPCTRFSRHSSHSFAGAKTALCSPLSGWLRGRGTLTACSAVIGGASVCCLRAFTSKMGFWSQVCPLFITHRHESSHVERLGSNNNITDRRVPNECFLRRGNNGDSSYRKSNSKDYFSRSSNTYTTTSRTYNPMFCMIRCFGFK